MQRYKITIEYDGTNFCGWQRQQKVVSVQQIIEEAIFAFTQEETLAYGSGRTDAGVHALGQVAHFDLSKIKPPLEIIGAINHYSRPHKLSILECELVPSDFHARFSAIERSYIYKIINRPSPLILMEKRAWHIIKKLNIAKMREALEYFLGSHDFTSFRATECQAKSPMKTITHLELTENGEEITISITAKSFLHHMVRNIVGTIVEAGQEKIAPHEIPLIFEAKKRAAAGQTAPAYGLYFLKILY